MNFQHRFTSETVDQIFGWILNEIAEAGYLSPTAVFIDGTHIKANANNKKKIQEEVRVAFDDVYEKVTEKFPEVETVVADSAYKTPHICKKIFDDNRVLSTAYKRPQTMNGGHEWWKYVYDEHYDCIICPEFHTLEYSTINRDGYREYKSNPEICKNCPTRELCTHSKDHVKVVQRHIWKDYEELADDARYTPKYADLYKQRKETIERVFADAKEKHAMRYTPYRGLAQVSNWVRLKFIAMNLKKFAKRKWRDNHPSDFFAFFSLFSNLYAKTPVFALN